MGQKFKIIRYPSKKGVIIWNETKLDTCYNHGFNEYNPERNYQHVNVSSLAIISDDKIRINDWFIDDCNQIRQSITDDEDYWSVRTDYKKVIMTTQGIIGSDISIPEIFVKDYVKAYNNGNRIDEIELEIGDNGKPKTNPDNSLIIYYELAKSKNEKLYTKEDIFDFLSDHFLEIRNTIPDIELKFKNDYINNLMKNIGEYGK